MRRIRRAAGATIALALVTAAPLTAWQQQAPSSEAPAPDSAVYRIAGLVVTGTSVPREASDMGAHVTVLQGDELRARGVTRVADALREVAGVGVVQSGSFGAVTSMFMRGGESDYVQVLVDGVKVNQPGGAFDFSGLTMGHVERIEIVRGPSSALYGSDAVTGVVHVISRIGDGAPRGSVSYRAGSFGSSELVADVVGAAGTARYGLTLVRGSTDGILDYNNQAANQIFNGFVLLAPDDRTSLRLSTRLGSRSYHYPTDGTGNVVDRNAYSVGDEGSFALDLSRRLSSRVDVTALLTSYAMENASDDRMDDVADTLGFFGYTALDVMRRSALEVRSNVALGAMGTATVGFEAEAQSQRSFSESSSEYGSSTSNGDNSRWNRGGFAHLVGDVGPVSLSGGVRLEENERFGRFLTWQAAASVAWSGTGRLRGAAGRAIKEPTFFENFSSSFALGNPELAPERSSSWEVGVEHVLFGGAVTVDATWFDQRFRDLIQYTFLPPRPGAPNFFNVAEADARGVEAGATFVAGAFSARADATWLATEVVDAGFDEGPGATFVEGESLLRRPGRTLGVSAAWNPIESLGLQVGLVRVGERADRDYASFPASAVVLDAYTLLSAAVRMTLMDARPARPGLEVTLRGENMLDVAYQEVFGFAAPGRGIYLGGRVTFGAR
jgi:vitamin B12 transporter